MITEGDVWAFIMWGLLAIALVAFVWEVGKELYQRDKDLLIPFAIAVAILSMYTFMQYLDSN